MLREGPGFGILACVQHVFRGRQRVFRTNSVTRTGRPRRDGCRSSSQDRTGRNPFGIPDRLPASAGGVLPCAAMPTTEKLDHDHRDICRCT